MRGGKRRVKSGEVGRRWEQGGGERKRQGGTAFTERTETRGRHVERRSSRL